MRLRRLIVGLVAGAAALGAVAAAAVTIQVTFPEVNGPRFTVAGPFPQPPTLVTTKTFTIPPGERIIAASISGSWGSSGDPDSTAAVTVDLNGVVVATCLTTDPGCFSDLNQGQRPWTHTFTPKELDLLGNGTATLTYVQTSEIAVRLGVSTLTVETAPPPVVPTLSPFGLGGALVLVAAAGAWALARSRPA